MSQADIFAVFENISCEIRKQLNTARSSVRICVAWISINEYMFTLKELIKRNVRIEIICNDEPRHRESFASLPACVEVYYVRPRRTGAFMHNKFCIIDNNTVINGSYNWSANAPNSFENIVVIKNCLDVTKSFMHEFYDLIEFDKGYRSEVCMQCNSQIFNLGIFGEETGKYNESLVSIWRVCVKNYHTQLEHQRDEQYVQSHFWPDHSDFDNDAVVCVESMLCDFHKEREKEKRLSLYFKKDSQTEIDAIGWVIIDNEMEHIEWGEEQEYAIKITWRNINRRKIIPEKLYESDGDVCDIINHHRIC
jgi:hypothetical protein